MLRSMLIFMWKILRNLIKNWEFFLTKIIKLILENMPIQKTWRKTQMTRAIYNCVALNDAVGIIITFQDFDTISIATALSQGSWLSPWHGHRFGIVSKSFIKLKYWTVRWKVQITVMFGLWIFALQILYCQVLHHHLRIGSNKKWTLISKSELVRHFNTINIQMLVLNNYSWTISFPLPRYKWWFDTFLAYPATAITPMHT